MSTPEAVPIGTAMPELLRARDLRELGLTRTDAERVMRRCGREVRFGRSVYVRREDVERVLLEAEATIRTA